MRIDLRQTIPSKVTSFLRPFGSKRPEVERLLPRSSFLVFYPFDIVVSTLAKGIDDSNEAVEYLRVVAGIDRQDIVAAMEVGRQFEDACSRSVP